MFSRANGLAIFLARGEAPGIGCLNDQRASGLTVNQTAGPLALRRLAYQLPPFLGKCQISVVNRGNYRDGSFFAATRTVPTVMPIIVELDHAGEQQIDLHEGETVAVRGNIHWVDGKPVENHDVRLLLSTGEFPRFEAAVTTTDANGQYEIRIPRDVEHAKMEIFIVGRVHPDSGNYHEARLAELPLDDKEVSRLFEVEDSSQDTNNVNWQLVEE